MTQKQFQARKLNNGVTRELGDEVVIYDTEQDRCHVLNPAAAVVWQQCEGNTSVEELASAIASKTGQPADSEVAYLALEELKNAGLLEGDPLIPALAGKRSRREMLAGMGALAALLPVVTSILAPSPAMAQSGPQPTTTTMAPEPTTTTAP